MGVKRHSFSHLAAFVPGPPREWPPSEIPGDVAPIPGAQDGSEKGPGFRLWEKDDESRFRSWRVALFQKNSQGRGRKNWYTLSEKENKWNSSNINIIIYRKFAKGNGQFRSVRHGFLTL
ncbi:hypothetical protein TNCT_349221 [Trichonephila clavata]|uniref:Uncharacterized protein n=1 Tax=Trichonephila clavata TaxID=2740835 RepID=A0A8X6M4R2_TRICU|nr:hypothetical protein TNCT_349221 [Trichonephila clavata]